MARRLYTDEERASVYVALAVNDGNVARSARDTGIAESTVRDWKFTWEREGVPLEVQTLADSIATGFVADAERVRDKALKALELAIDTGELKNDKLITVVGVLEDKIRLGKGLATSRSETVHSLPDPQEVQHQLAAAVLQVLSTAKERELDIIDAEIVEETSDLALPAAR